MSGASTQDLVETKRVLDEILLAAVIPHAEKITRIAADGDTAVVFYEPETETAAGIALLDELRGSQTGAVVRLTRTRAARIFDGDPATRKWTTTRVRGIERILLFARRAVLRVNHDPTVRKCCWVDDGVDASCIELLRPRETRPNGRADRRAGSDG